MRVVSSGDHEGDEAKSPRSRQLPTSEPSSGFPAGRRSVSTRGSLFSILNFQFSILFLLLVSCRPACQYPDDKFWAHGATGVGLGRNAEELFGGRMEVDINYSDYRDSLFLGHDLCDTAKGLTLDAWLDSLRHPADNWYWLDLKNLTPANAPRVAHRLCCAARRHGILSRAMVESQNDTALRTLRDSGLHVILWVDNPWWSGVSEEQWLENTRRQVQRLHPDAFPRENIHIWDTPRDDNDTNCAHSLMIAAHPAVKVVLVDYSSPPEP